MIRSSFSAFSARWIPSNVATSPCWFWTPRPELPSRTKRLRTKSLKRAEPASWSSTNGIWWRTEIEKRNKKQRTEGQAKIISTLGEFGQWVQDKLFFLDYAPVIFTSAKSGFHLDRLLV